MTTGYFQVDVQTASPQVLVLRLLEKAILCTRQGLEAPPEAEPAARNASLNRALDIVAELRSALDFETGQEIACNLDALYEFVGARLLAGAVEPDLEPLEDALRILEILVEPWRQLERGELPRRVRRMSEATDALGRVERATEELLAALSGDDSARLESAIAAREAALASLPLDLSELDADRMHSLLERQRGAEAAVAARLEALRQELAMVRDARKAAGSATPVPATARFVCERV